MLILTIEIVPSNWRLKQSNLRLFFCWESCC